MTTEGQPPAGLETKNLPGGYAAAPTPAADVLGYHQATDTLQSTTPVNEDEPAGAQAEQSATASDTEQSVAAGSTETGSATA